MARTMMVAGNWKMNKTSAEAVSLIRGLKRVVRTCGKMVDIVVAPPFPALHSVSTNIDLDKSALKLAAQNMFYEPKGAFTGEVSPSMLVAEKCSYVILGHSERREYFDETDEIVNRKVKVAFENNLVPIVCCGESLEIREEGETSGWITDQITAALGGLGREDATRLVIAYEPIWAIGTGKTATSEMAQETCALIRRVVFDLFDEAISKEVRILYGGSVTEYNAHLFFSQPDIDGALVGGASLESDSFGKIVEAANASE